MAWLVVACSGRSTRHAAGGHETSGSGGEESGGTAGGRAGGSGGSVNRGGSSAGGTDGTEPGGEGGEGTTRDPCEGMRCSMHGACVVVGRSARCECEPGYASPDDDPTVCKDADACDPEPCENSGACIRIGSGFACSCRAGFAGERCERAVPVVAVGSHVCTLELDGSVHCWGDNFYGQCNAPAEAFRLLANGTTFSCGQRTDDVVMCWGETTAIPLSPLSEPAVELVAADNHACALLAATREPFCWGSNDYGELDAPPGVSFSRLSTSIRQTCGVRTSDGEIQCWGGDAANSATPSGEFAAIGTGTEISGEGDIDGDFGCAIAKDGGDVRCWGASAAGEAAAPPGAFRALAGGISQACAVGADDGAVSCWGDGFRWPLSPPTDGFDSVGVGVVFGCGLRRSSEDFGCWAAPGEDFFPASSAYRTTTYTTVSAGSPVCVVRSSDGAVECTGFEGSPPRGSFRSVSSSGDEACGIRADGSLACWGNAEPELMNPPAGTFTLVSTGGAHACAIRSSDASVACWGSNEYGQASPPSGAFREVSSGGAHTCGIDDEGSVRCWGSDGAGESSPPSGRFEAVSAGLEYTCGIHSSDRFVECWGNSMFSPPSLPFDTLSAGFSHACGLRSSDHAVECWGDNQFGESASFSGPFEAVSAGGDRTCALDAERHLRCWGDFTL